MLMGSSRCAIQGCVSDLTSHRYGPDFDLDEALDGATLVLVHEWNEPSLVAHIGSHRKRSGAYTLLFHDTHHRWVTDPEAMSRYDLSGYDGVLAFGASLSPKCIGGMAGDAVFGCGTKRLMCAGSSPPLPNKKEISSGSATGAMMNARLSCTNFLFEPVQRLRLKARIHGVRYPDDAQRALVVRGHRVRGLGAELSKCHGSSRDLSSDRPCSSPAVLDRASGVPTIRIFEALACGMPLVSAPWSDSEGLFTPGEDFLFARTGRDAAPLGCFSVITTGRQP